MSLGDAAVKIRLRGPWEGQDLGFAMARRWFWPLWGLWWLCALPLTAVSVLVFGVESPVTYLLLWWCKPLFEWPVLYWLGQRVFSEPPGLRAALLVLKPAYWRDLVPYLLWRRLSFHRSFTMPVGLLERLRGTARRARVKVLSQGQNAVVWLLLVCLHFEWVLNIGLYLIIIFFADSEYTRSDFFTSLVFFTEQVPGLGLAVLLLTWSLIAPFYSAAGFAAYLTRRTQLEAWDLELVFRQIAQRLQRAAPLLLLIIAGLCLMAPVKPAEAQQPEAVAPPAETIAAEPMNAARARELIEQVIAHEDFGQQETRVRWKRRNAGAEQEQTRAERDENWVEQIGRTIGLLVEVGLWACVVVVAFFGVRYLTRLAGLVRPRPQPAAAAAVPSVDELLEDEIPSDVGAAVRALLVEDRRREALSLLYRASLQRLRQGGAVEIPDSATEGECRDLVARQCGPQQSRYFSQLTQAWITAAYGLRPPDSATIERLNTLWPELFGAPA